MKIVVCMPAYNEEDCIAYTVLKCQKYAKDIFVIDDRSKDRTAAIAWSLGAKVVSHRENLGYGGAIRTCFLIGQREKADCLVILDSDGQHDPDFIPALTAPIENDEADLVIGSRFISGKGRKKVPIYRMLGIQTITQVFNLGTNMALTDSQSGFRAYSRKALNAIKVTSDRMDASMEILFESKDNRFRIKEVPVEVQYVGLRGSSERPFSHGFAVLTNTMRMIRERYPIRFFGWGGIISITLTIPVFIYSKMNYNVGTGVLPIGSMFIITFLAILGSFMIFTGIMLQGVNRITEKIIEIK
jgi:glycosyltransferase involved in cell wall biosynthesis